MDIVITDFFSQSAFPVKLSDLESAFSSTNRLRDLISQYKTTVIQALVPGLSKAGYTETAVPVASSTNPTPAQPRRGYYPDPGGPLIGPSNPQHPQPVQPVGGGSGGGYRPFPGIGQSDLDPLAGLGGTTNPRGRIPLGGGEADGMLLGPNHPLFRDRNTGSGSPFNLPGQGGGQQGIWGGDGFLPPGAVPPGARFDPIGPMGMGGPRGGFPGQGQGLGGPPGGRRDILRPGDPSFDEFRPPTEVR